MPGAMIAALFFTVALLVTTTYSILGSIPLLVLKHDTPLDARFVRGFFNTYYLGAMATAGAAAVSYALAGNPGFAAGAAGLAVLATVLRRRVIGKMDVLRVEMQASGADAIPRFRRTHVFAILVNLLQLVLIVWTLISFSLK
jgi:hypothetical protein